MINIWLIIAFFGCINLDQECVLTKEFVDTWWVVTDPANMDEVCYLFSSDGKVVTKDSDKNNSISDNWSTNDTGCLKSISTESIEITILGTVDDCIIAEYEGHNLTVCACPTDKLRSI